VWILLLLVKTGNFSDLAGLHPLVETPEARSVGLTCKAPDCLECRLFRPMSEWLNPSCICLVLQLTIVLEVQINVDVFHELDEIRDH
jgi:hypothetical protein